MALATGCGDTTEDPPASCADGEKKCSEGKLSSCIDGEWGEATACPEGQMCHDMDGDHDHCMPMEMSCMDGETKCMDGKLSTCANAMWGAGEACPAGETCVEVDGKTDTCEASSEG